jgi:hypothetical protein
MEASCLVPSCLDYGTTHLCREISLGKKCGRREGGSELGLCDPFSTYQFTYVTG